MNRRSIVTIAILGTSAFVVFLLALVLTFIFLRRRCKKKTTTTTEETDERSITTTTTVEDGVTNFGLIEEDGLVSATKQRAPDAPDARTTPEGLDPRVEQMLDDAYADARQFAKFPNLP